MSDAPIKSYILTGNLNRRGLLSTELCQENTNISIGLWNVCVSSLCFDCKDLNGLFSKISCNLVIEKQLNPVTKMLETSNSNIGAVFFKGRKIVYLDKTWFTINHQSSELKLFFSNFQNNEPLLIDCEVYVTLLFQRVK
jgi:hypothetical protein